MNHSNDLSLAKEKLVVSQFALSGDEKKRFLDAYFAMPGKEPSLKGGAANGA